MPQNRGIRQGCPLSPVLFIIVLSAVMHDVHNDLGPEHTHQQDWGTNFSELMYADDTVLIARTNRGLEKLLHSVEKVSCEYGLRLNKDKCCLINMNDETKIHFSDGAEVPSSFETQYLGANINKEARGLSEVNKRLAQATVTWRKLGVFWKNSACPLHTKLHIYDAVIRAKLVYGLETIAILETWQLRLNAFHLRGLRQILKKETTYAQMIQGEVKSNTNESIFELANNILKHQWDSKPRDVPYRPIKPVSQYIAERSLALCGHVLRCSDKDPLRRVTFKKQSAIPKLYHKNRSGRPRYHWTHINLDRAVHKLVQSNDYLLHRLTPGTDIETLDHTDVRRSDILMEAARRHLF